MSSNKIRVAVLTTVHDPNDTRIYHRQIHSLLKNGYEVFYLCKENPKTKSSASIVLLPQIQNVYLRMLFSPFIALFKAIQLKDVQIYHLHDPELIFVGLILKAFRKVVIYDAHEDLPSQVLTKNWIPLRFRKPISILSRWTENHFLRLFDAVITVTQPLIDRFEYAGLKRIVLVRNYPLKNELVTSESFEKFYDLIYVGEASVPRGLQVMIEAFLLSKQAKNFVIIGRMNPTNFLDKYLLHEKFKHIHYVGPKTRKEVALFLAKSKIGIVPLLDTPNNRVGYPTKFFEYMSVSLPVVSTNLPLIEEINCIAQSSILVPPNSADEMALAIDALLSNPDKMKDLANHGRKAIEEQFSWEKEELKLLNLYSELNLKKKED